jgi:hypothetical protein
VSATRQRPALVRYRDAVTGMMEQGEPFGQVEHTIEVAELSEEQKAALWLWAFSIRDRRHKQHELAANLASLS